MIRWKYMSIFSVVVFALLLSGLVDPASARGRRRYHHSSHFGLGWYGGHYRHYPFWSFHYYGHPFSLYYEEPYDDIRYRSLNFRLPGFFHYLGAIGKGEITPQNPAGQADKPVSQETQQK